MGLFDFFESRKHKQAECSNSSANEEQHTSGVCDIPLDAKYTPENITTLGRRDIFVFGSNLSGHHAGGAARVALNRFGAVWGQGEGLQGNSYAIPTMQGDIDTIQPYVDRFIEFAEYEKGLTFYVTKIGCGIAGFEIKDIAPLFKKALVISNIRLPKEFVDIIGREDDEIPRDELLIHSHGVARTFADIVIAQNNEVGFRSPDEVMSFLNQYFDRFKRNGDDVAFIAVRIVWNILHNKDLFKNGILDVDALNNHLFEFSSYGNEMDKAYDSHCREKLFNIIVYLNMFRRYQSPEEVLYDINSSGITHFSHCGPNCDYFMSPIRAGLGYPLFYFKRFLTESWDKIKNENGTLDPHRLDELMFNRYERGVRKYGLEATIQRDYIEDSPCHPEVFVPKEMGTAPIYVKDSHTGRYTRSCGEGKGPNSIPDWLEFQIAKQILEKDKSYKHIGSYYIPKYDNTLPVYGDYYGRLVFKTQDEKLKFIEDVKLGKSVWR